MMEDEDLYRNQSDVCREGLGKASEGVVLAEIGWVIWRGHRASFNSKPDSNRIIPLRNEGGFVGIRRSM